MSRIKDIIKIEDLKRESSHRVLDELLEYDDMLMKLYVKPIFITYKNRFKLFNNNREMDNMRERYLDENRRKVR